MPSGKLHPSGNLLRADPDAIREAGDALFGKLPLPEVSRNYRKAVAAVRPGHKPYAAIFGLIPGEGSEEEFATVVANLG